MRVQMLVDVIVRKIKMPKEPDEPLEALSRRDFRIWALRTLGAPENQLPDTWAKEKAPGESGPVWSTDVFGAGYGRKRE